MCSGMRSWGQSRRTTFYQPTAYNTLMPQPTTDPYLGTAGISNVRGRRRHYSGTGIVSLGGGGIGNRLGYGGPYSSSINALNGLPSSYAGNPGNRLSYGEPYSSSINALNGLPSSYPENPENRLGYGGPYSSSINALNRFPSSYPTPTMNATLLRNNPSHHSSSYPSLPLMTTSPTHGLLHPNSRFGNLGASSFYGRYPSSTTLLNTDIIGWRR